MTKNDHELITELEAVLTSQEYNPVVVRNYCASAIRSYYSSIVMAAVPARVGIRFPAPPFTRDYRACRVGGHRRQNNALQLHRSGHSCIMQLLLVFYARDACDACYTEKRWATPIPRKAVSHAGNLKLLLALVVDLRTKQCTRKPPKRWVWTSIRFKGGLMVPTECRLACAVLSCCLWLFTGSSN